MKNLLKRIPSGSWGLLVAVVGIFLLGMYSARLPTLTRGILEAVLFVLLVHAIEKVYFWRDLLTTVGHQIDVVASRQRDLLGNALQCGMTAIYKNRSDAQKDIMLNIEKAKNRIWLLGIALSKDLSFLEADSDGRPSLPRRLMGKKQNNRDFDLKILLLDPLRSPAVFRSFLESTPHDIGKVLRNADGFFDQTLYRRVEETFNFISGSGKEILGDATRFYGHDPSCWLAIVDDTAYYEPYTFGASPDTADLCIGGYLPVYKFDHTSVEVADGKKSSNLCFGILEDHFAKLWITSDVDCFHFGMRRANKADAIRQVIEQRMTWLRAVQSSLQHWDKNKNEWYEHRKWPERRAHPRLPCNTSSKLRLTWTVGSNSSGCEANVIDYSKNGICVQLSGARVNAFVTDVGEAIDAGRGAERGLALTFPVEFPHGHLRGHFEGTTLVAKRSLTDRTTDAVKVHLERIPRDA